MEKRLRKLKPDIPGPMDCLQVFWNGRDWGRGWDRLCHKSPTILTELTALLSPGVELPWARIKKKKRKRKSPLYSFTNSFSTFSLHSHKNMLSLATITYGNGKNKNSSCNDGKELGLSSGICFKDVSVEELGHASRQNCVFLSTWGKGHVARHSHKSLSPLASQAPDNCLPTTISPLLHARN